MFHWVAQAVNRSPKNDVHFESVAYLKPILDAWKKGNFDVVGTAVSEDEIGRHMVVNRDQLGYSPNLIEKEDFYLELLNRKTLPKNAKPSAYYTWENTSLKKQIRELYIEGYPNEDWQKFRQKINAANLVDAFIFWQSSKLRINYIVAADGGFVRNVSHQWGKHVQDCCTVISAKDFVEKYNVGSPDKSWTTKIQSNFGQQRMYPSGYIQNATGYLWFIKRLLRRNLGFTPPKDANLIPTDEQILKALFNLKFNIVGKNMSGYEDGFFGPDDFDQHE